MWQKQVHMIGPSLLSSNGIDHSVKSDFFQTIIVLFVEYDRMVDIDY